MVIEDMNMRRCLVCLFAILCLFPLGLFAQTRQVAPEKFALVIGNGAYVDLTRLANPVNDANDIAAALRQLGFNVEIVLDGTMNQMEDAVLRLRDKLSESDEAYGFFFYAEIGRAHV